MSSEEKNSFMNILSQNRPNIIDALLHGPQKAFDEAGVRELLNREDLDRITSKESKADKIREKKLRERGVMEEEGEIKEKVQELGKWQESEWRLGEVSIYERGGGGSIAGKVGCLTSTN